MSNRKLMEKLDEIDEDSLSTADLAYYTEVNARIMKKLAYLPRAD